jgi:hypothetical protein
LDFGLRCTPVGLLVEIEEQEEHEDVLRETEVQHELRVLAIGGTQLDGTVNSANDELELETET